MAPAAVCIIDTSVFVADALAVVDREPASVLALIVTDVLLSVSCDELRLETLEKLEEVAGLASDVIDARYGPVWTRTLFVPPVVETDQHRQFVAGDADDTVLPRTAEAIYEHAPDAVVVARKYIVSRNTKHLRPGSSWGGFLVSTPGAVVDDLA